MKEKIHYHNYIIDERHAYYSNTIAVEQENILNFDENNILGSYSAPKIFKNIFKPFHFLNHCSSLDYVSLIVYKSFDIQRRNVEQNVQSMTKGK